MLRKRIVAAMLTGVMAVSVLSGCSGGKKAPDTTTAATTGTAAAQGAADDGISPGAAAGAPISAEPITIRVFAAKGVDVGDYSSFDYLNEYCEKNNIKVEWECVNLDLVDDRMNVIVASGDLPDMFWGLTNKQYEQLKQAGALASIQGYLGNCPNFNAVIAEYPEAKKYYMEPDGTVYMMPMLDGLTVNQPLLCRKDWLDELGMEAPVTKEDWYQYWVAVRDNDMNKNGDPNDEIPFTAEKFSYLLSMVSAFEMVDGFFVDAQDNNTVKFSYTDPRYKEYLEWMHMLWEENLIDHNIFTSDKKTLQNNNALNLVGSYSGKLNGQMNTYLSAIGSNIEGYDLVGTEPMMSDHGMQLHPFSQSLVKCDSSTSGAVISVTSKYARECVELCDWFYDYSDPDGGGFMNIFGHEGDTFVYNDDKSDYNYSDTVLHNPDGLSPQQVLSAKTTRGQHAGYVKPIGSFKMWYPQVEDAYNKLAPFYDESLKYMIPALPFSDAQNKEIRSTMADINTFVEEGVSNFIIGNEPIENFDLFVEKINGMGIERILDIYNEAYAEWNQPRN